MSYDCDSDFEGMWEWEKEGLMMMRDGEYYNVNVDKLFIAPYKLIQGIYCCCN